MNATDVSLAGVGYVYPDGRQALRGVDLTVVRGESVGLVGANGAGKSTILLLLMGVLFPVSGEVRVFEELVRRQTLSELRKRVGLVFQDPDDQLFMPTVWEDVTFGPLHQKLPVEEVERRGRAALGQVGAEALAERRSHHLSGGERRAAAIATVLAMEPECLLLDEPSANLDPGTRRKLIGWLNAFSQTRIIASHDLDLVLECCDRVVVLRDGEVVAHGASEDLLRDVKLLSQAGLELPLCLQGPRGRR